MDFAAAAGAPASAIQRALGVAMAERGDEVEGKPVEKLKLTPR